MNRNDYIFKVSEEPVSSIEVKYRRLQEEESMLLKADMSQEKKDKGLHDNFSAVIILQDYFDSEIK